MTDAEQTEALCKVIAPVLRGHKPEVQSAALADLLATWLAGHFIPGDPVMTRRIREEILLQKHVQLVKDLVPICEEQISALRENPQ